MNDHTLFKIGKQLLHESDIENVLAKAMDAVIELSGAERAMIILFGQDGEIMVETARNLDQTDIDALIAEAMDEWLPWPSTFPVMGAAIVCLTMKWPPWTNR